MTATNRIQLLPIISPLIAIASSLIVGAILILLAGANPIAAYTALFQESQPLILFKSTLGIASGLRTAGDCSKIAMIPVRLVAKLELLITSITFRSIISSIKALIWGLIILFKLTRTYKANFL